MAQLAVQWFLPTQLVLDFAAMTACLVLGVEVLVGIVNTVRGTCLPLVLSFGRVGLLMSSWVNIVSFLQNL